MFRYLFATLLHLLLQAGVAGHIGEWVVYQGLIVVEALPGAERLTGQLCATAADLHCAPLSPHHQSQPSTLCSEEQSL